jgi:hypothetical protein
MDPAADTKNLKNATINPDPPGINGRVMGEPDIRNSSIERSGRKKISPFNGLSYL